jgi:flagellar basal body-associated protein FliL
MSEQQESMSSTLKNTIIGVVVTIITAIGGVITTQFEKLFGGDEPAVEAAAPAQAPAPIILNIENNQTQNNNAGGGTKVVEKVVEKPAPEKPKAKEDVEW